MSHSTFCTFSYYQQVSPLGVIIAFLWSNDSNAALFKDDDVPRDNF
jgi:hypothetical protein